VLKIAHCCGLLPGLDTRSEAAAALPSLAPAACRGRVPSVQAGGSTVPEYSHKKRIIN